MEYQKIKVVSKNSQQNNSERVTNDKGKIYISRKKGKKWLIIWDEL